MIIFMPYLPWIVNNASYIQIPNRMLCNELKQMKRWRIEEVAGEGPLGKGYYLWLLDNWNIDDLIIIESAKAPDISMIEKMELCTEDLCTQMLYQWGEFSEGVLRTSANYNISDECSCNDHKKGFNVMGHHLHYVGKGFDEDPDFCDCSATGVIKISKKFQEEHRVPDFEMYKKIQGGYICQDSINQYLEDNYKVYGKWHRHKEVSWRSPYLHRGGLKDISIYVPNPITNDGYGGF